MSGYTAVHVTTCPNCATPGIKTFDFPENISNSLSPDNLNTYIYLEPSPEGGTSDEDVDD